jgi:hypothetical protein
MFKVYGTEESLRVAMHYNTHREIHNIGYHTGACRRSRSAVILNLTVGGIMVATVVVCVWCGVWRVVCGV